MSSGKDARSIVEQMMSEDTAHDLRTPYFSQSDLLKRGWSKRLIERLLGEPDWTAPNPHFPGAAPMLCWNQDRVFAAESTAPFQERKSRKGK